jgi:hypothetical protein
VWHVKPRFLGHALARSELCAALTEATRDGSAELLTFDAEPASWRPFTGSSGEAAQLKPDAFVRVGIGAVESSAFVEIDQGTESLPTIRRKCEQYVFYWRAGREQQAHGVFPLVVWLVTTAARRDQIRGVVHRLPPEVRPLFAVALQTDGPALLTAGPDGGSV